MVEGRIAKLMKERALLEQAFIKDTTKTVEQYIMEMTAAIGEKISIRRFERFNLGEGLEKKNEDFAAEIAKQTQAKAEPKVRDTNNTPARAMNNEKCEGLRFCLPVLPFAYRSYHLPTSPLPTSPTICLPTSRIRSPLPTRGCWR
eukprot:5725063-Pyramimonas_sp.AAC.1